MTEPVVLRAPEMPAFSEENIAYLEEEDAQIGDSLEEAPQLFAGKYKSVEELERGYKELQKLAARQPQEQEAKEEAEKNWRPTAKGGVLRGGRLARPLLQSEIEDMQKQAQSAKHCARLLGVSYPTYKKYAKMYGVFENCKNEAGVGIHKLNKGRKSHSLENILEGGNPSYPNWKLKKRLLETGYMPQVCANCGYDEPRVTDNKVPLLLDYMDGNRKNHKWDNLRMLCYNCWFQQC